MPPTKKLGAQQLVPQATAQTLQLATPDFSRFDRLARSLEEFGSTVATAGVRKQQELAQKEKARGAQAGQEAIARGLDTEKELVDAKIITRGEGSFFRDGVLEQAGQAHANAFSNAILIASAKAGLQDSTDLEEIDELIQEVAGQFNADDQGEAFAAGFAAQAAEVAQQHKERHAQVVAQNIENIHTDGVTDKYRGVSLVAIEGVDDEFIVENLVNALQAAADDHLGVITDPEKYDFDNSNKALTNALISLLNDGSINGDQAEEVHNKLNGGTGPLGGIVKHSNALQDAIDNQIIRQARRDDNVARLELKEKNDRGKTARADMFRNSKDGLLDVSAIIDQQTRDATSFTPEFVARAIAEADLYEAQSQKDYLSNQAVIDDYTFRILNGEAVRSEEIGLHLVEGELNNTDAVRLARLATEWQNMRANDPVGANMWDDVKILVKTGLGGFSGRAFGEQAWANAVPALQQAWNEIRIKEPEWTNMSVEYRKWSTDQLNILQQVHLERDEWEDLQRAAALRIAVSETIPYQDNLFESNPDILIQYYAEALELQENGREPSDGLLSFFNAPGRQLSEEGSANPDNYVVGLEGQLFQAKIDSDDERIKAARRAMQFRPRAGTQAGSSTAAPVSAARQETTGGPSGLEVDELLELLKPGILSDSLRDRLDSIRTDRARSNPSPPGEED